MTPVQKQEAVAVLKDKFSQYTNFYVTNTESLTVAQISKLRRICFEKGVEMQVAKNTLIRKAMESISDSKYTGLYDSLAGVTALMFSDSPKEPAVILSDFRGAKGDKPVLKAAFIGEDVFVGDDQLTSLKNIKTKNELIGEVLGLLMSPISRVLSALENKGEAAGATGADTTATSATTVDAPAEAAAPTEAPAATEDAAPAAEPTPEA